MKYSPRRATFTARHPRHCIRETAPQTPPPLHHQREGAMHAPLQRTLQQANPRSIHNRGSWLHIRRGLGPSEILKNKKTVRGDPRAPRSGAPATCMILTRTRTRTTHTHVRAGGESCTSYRAQHAQQPPRPDGSGTSPPQSGDAAGCAPAALVATGGKSLASAHSRGVSTGV